MVELQRQEAQLEEKAHNVKDVPIIDVTELQRRKSHLGLQLEQSHSKILYLEQRQRIKDDDTEKQLANLKERKPIFLKLCSVKWNKQNILDIL